MLIAHITDSHIELPEPQGAGRIADFERVIDDIIGLPEKPDMVIHTGDITHCDKPQEYEFARSRLERLPMPWHVIPGNKDRRANLANAFGLDNGFVQKVVETPDWQLILLDTLSDTSNKGTFCAERRKWLQEKLAAADKPVALFMHHPSFHMTDNPYPFQFVEQTTADAFDRLVTGFANVKGVFCGHAHRNTTGKVGHIPGMTLTAMSLDRRKGTYPDEMAGKPLYQLIRFGQNGTFERQLKICN